MPRQRLAELMDDPAVDPAQLRRALAALRWVNRHLGGTAALLNHLQRWSRRWPRDHTIALLDIGTASADLPLAACAWARRAGFRLRVTAIDLHARTLELARHHIARAPDLARDIDLVQADARALTHRFAPESFDYAHAGLFLHHLSDLEVMTVLRMMDRLVRRGLIWNDLMRTPVARVVVHLATIGAPRIVQHDARASVAAAFTRNEALDLCRRAGVDYVRFRARWLHQRFTVAGERPGAWP